MIESLLTTLKAQSDIQNFWSLTGVTAPFSRQSTCSGSTTTAGGMNVDPVLFNSCWFVFKPIIFALTSCGSCKLWSLCQHFWGTNTNQEKFPIRTHHGSYSWKNYPKRTINGEYFLLKLESPQIPDFLITHYTIICTESSQYSVLICTAILFNHNLLKVINTKYFNE